MNSYDPRCSIEKWRSDFTNGIEQVECLLVQGWVFRMGLVVQAWVEKKMGKKEEKEAKSNLNVTHARESSQG